MNKDREIDPLSLLNEAEQFAKENVVEVSYEDINISEILENELISDSNDTISLFYNPEDKEAVLVLSGKRDRTYTEIIEPEEYLDICERVHIKENNNYNDSQSFVIGGVKVRAFALTKPVSDYPNITISTSKKSPATWDQIELTDVLKNITRYNYLVVGASGAGKTYLMNYLLKEQHKDDNSKIGLIEEFSELFKPNKSTSSLIVPPNKPGKERLLQYITEMSNLMRFDYIYIGEIKGTEAWPFLINLSSGTRGAATMHGSSAKFGLNRLLNLCLLTGMPEKVITDTIAKSINYVIYVEKHEIKEITRLTGVAINGNFQLDNIWSKIEGFRSDFKL